MARQNSRGVTQFRSASPVPWRSQFYRGGDLYDEVRATLLVRRRPPSRGVAPAGGFGATPQVGKVAERARQRNRSRRRGRVAFGLSKHDAPPRSNGADGATGEETRAFEDRASGNGADDRKPDPSALVRLHAGDRKSV